MKMWVELTEDSTGFDTLYLELLSGPSFCLFGLMLLISAPLVLCLTLSLSNHYRPGSSCNSKPSLFLRVWCLLFGLRPSWTTTASEKRAYQLLSHQPCSTLTVLCHSGTYHLHLSPAVFPVTLGGGQCVQKEIRPLSHSTIQLVTCWIIHVFKKYILNVYKMPGAVLGTTSTAIKDIFDVII